MTTEIRSNSETKIWHLRNRTLLMAERNGETSKEISVSPLLST